MNTQAPAAPSTTSAPLNAQAPTAAPSATTAAPAASPAAPNTAPPASPAAEPNGSDGAHHAALSGDPVLFVSEGLDGLLSVSNLRARLSDALGRELVSLVDARAHRAHATVWVGVGDSALVLRVTPPQRPEVWRQLPRDQLGPDPVATVVKAVLEMFWADTFARLDATEIQDPFCPPGLICVDARRPLSWPPVPDAEVLDPWDQSYRRFYGWDPFSYPYRYSGSMALTPPYPGQQVQAQGLGPSPYWPSARPAIRSPRAPRLDHYALGFLSGGGVHKGGAFFRYELNGLRRFRRFDFGLAFIGARGQPEPATKARRAVTALLQRRFVAEDFELDLGTSFGTFFATFADRHVEVRPYLRGMVTFALPLGRVFDLLVQSELATTFLTVPRTGAVEYALSLGLRHRM